MRARRRARPHRLAPAAALGRPRAGPGRGLVRAVSPVASAASRGSAARVPDGGRHGFRRAVPAAHPSHRHHGPQGPQQHPRRRAPTTPAARGPSGARRRAHRHPPGARHHRGLRRSWWPRSSAHGMEVALDYALQCSPDHPWVTEHPGVVPPPPGRHRSPTPRTRRRCTRTSTRSTSGRPAEADRVALWEACKEILELLDLPRGADLPGRQPPHQADRLLGVADRRGAGRPSRGAVPGRGVHPARRSWPAWPRPASARATPTSPGGPSSTARRGCGPTSRSWPTGPMADYMRPNFWPNTPDILSGPLRYGPPAAFALRLVLAATMSPSYGVYSGYELYENEPGLGAERGVPRLGEVRDQGPGLQPAGQPGPADDRAQRHPPAPPGPAAAAVDSLPPDRPTRRSSPTRS